MRRMQFSCFLYSSSCLKTLQLDILTGEVHPSCQDGRFLHHMEGRVHHNAVCHLVRLQARVNLQQVSCRHRLNNHRWEHGRVIQLNGTHAKEGRDVELSAGGWAPAVLAYTYVYMQ